MRWPQILMIVLMSMDMLLSIILHGEPKEGKYDAGVTLITVFLYIAILYAGGFWNAQ